MSALAAISATLIERTSKPVTATSGGTSEGDPEAGMDVSRVKFKPIGPGDRTGAAILTFLLIVCMLSAAWWMIVGD